MATATTTRESLAHREGLQRKRPDKADLQAQLAERDPYKLLELDELRWQASADDIKGMPPRSSAITRQADGC